MPKIRVIIQCRRPIQICLRRLFLVPTYLTFTTGDFMKNNMLKNSSALRSLFVLLLGSPLMACSTPHAAKNETLSYDEVRSMVQEASKKETASSSNEDESFEVASAAGDSTLSEMRGGFIYAGGMKINFGIFSSTSINSVPVTTLSYATNSTLANTIQQLIQSGNGNSAAGSSNNSSSNPATTASTSTPTVPSVPQVPSTPSVPQVPSTPELPATPELPSTPTTIASVDPGTSGSQNNNVTTPTNNTAPTNSGVPVVNSQGVTPPVTTPTITTPVIPTNTVTVPTTITVPSNIMSVVQNSLSNQLIQNQNILSITVNNFAAYRSYNMGFASRFGYGVGR